MTVDDLRFMVHYLRTGKKERDDLTDSREDGRGIPVHQTTRGDVHGTLEEI